MGLGFWFQAVQETKGHVEKKQALTYEEIEAEREEVKGMGGKVAKQDWRVRWERRGQWGRIWSTPMYDTS